MSSETCGACGAASDANFLTCQYCGAAAVTLDPEQELQAIRELAATARKIGGESENVLQSLMAQSGAAEGSSKKERIAQLWTNAFIPLTFEAQYQAIAQVVSAITTTGRSDHAGKIVANETLIRRGEMLVAAMEANAANDPSLAGRAAAIKTQFEQTRGEAKNLKKKGYRKAYITIAMVPIMLGLLFFFATVIMPKMMPKIDDGTPPTGDPIPAEFRGEYTVEEYAWNSGCSESKEGARVTSNTISWWNGCHGIPKISLSGVTAIEAGGVLNIVTAQGNGMGGHEAADCKGSSMERSGDKLIVQVNCSIPRLKDTPEKVSKELVLLPQR